MPDLSPRRDEANPLSDRGYEDLQTRIGRVRFLLDNWEIIWSPFVGSAMSGGGSGLPPGLSLLAKHPGVKELDRCLRRLERHDVRLFRHVKAYRCGVEWRNVTRQVRVKRSRGKGYEIVPRRIREPLTPSWVSLDRVDEAERFLAAEFQGEVFIPDELWDAYRRPAVAA